MPIRDHCFIKLLTPVSNFRGQLTPLPLIRYYRKIRLHRDSMLQGLATSDTLYIVRFRKKITGAMYLDRFQYTTGVPQLYFKFLAYTVQCITCGGVFYGFTTDPTFPRAWLLIRI